MDLHEGMLIYCRRQGDLDESTLTVRNAGKKLTLRSVDLSGTPEQVEREIAVLADAIAKTSPVAFPSRTSSPAAIL